jgi:hypothetical protein
MGSRVDRLKDHGMAGAIILLVAAAIALKAFTVLVKERRLAARLLPTRARVIDPGQTAQTRWQPRADADTQQEQQVTVFIGVWEYEVGGRVHRGQYESTAPVFTREQMPPASIEVYRDSDDPGVSRLYKGGDSALVRSWFIFAAVAAVVGLVVLAIEHGPPARRP